MSDELTPFEQDKHWFVVACRQQHLPKPSEEDQDEFAILVHSRLSKVPYANNPTESARNSIYNDYKSGKWGSTIL